jgi:hypothetical protein
MNYVEEFVADPASFVEDPLQGLQAGTGGMGGPDRRPCCPFIEAVHFRAGAKRMGSFRRPGVYRVYVISRRVSATDKPGPAAGTRVEHPDPEHSPRPRGVDQAADCRRAGNSGLPHLAIPAER